MNLTKPETLATDLLGQHGLDSLGELEQDLIATEAPVEEQLAVKLARSKASVNARNGPFHVSVVFAMYKETRRMLRPDQDPIGEDFVNVKVSQLQWLFGDRASWDLVIVDDGCPDGSGRMAQQIILDQGYEDVARVMFIADAIDSGHPVVAGLESPDQSRKGGSIQLGMYEAVNEGISGQIVVYTDADISTHLGQVGLLAQALESGVNVAAGSRREPTSVVVKSGARSDRGKLFIYLWKQVLPQLRDIVDSQCGFKAFPANRVWDLVMNTVEKQFAFDIELLLRSELDRPDSIARVPVAWIDSEAGSTTTDLEPYLPMLRAIALMHRHYTQPSPRPDSFANLIEAMDQAAWERLLDSIPTPITDREPIEYTTWHGVDATEIGAHLE
jgi:hypothetical protein